MDRRLHVHFCGSFHHLWFVKHHSEIRATLRWVDYTSLQLMTSQGLRRFQLKVMVNKLLPTTSCSQKSLHRGDTWVTLKEGFVVNGEVKHVESIMVHHGTMVVPMVVPLYRWYGTISKCATLAAPHHAKWLPYLVHPCPGELDGRLWKNERSESWFMWRREGETKFPEKWLGLVSVLWIILKCCLEFVWRVSLILT